MSRTGLPWYIHTLGRMFAIGVQAGLPDGRWVAAVGEPYTAGRILAAWWVLTGRAYAIRWPVPGELEDVFRSAAPPQAAGRMAPEDRRDG